MIVIMQKLNIYGRIVNFESMLILQAYAETKDNLESVCAVFVKEEIMVVKVVDKNKEKIEKILATVNGRARRRILNYESLLDVVKTAQSRIEGVLGSSKSALYGAKVFYVPNEVFPRYFYEPEP